MRGIICLERDLVVGVLDSELAGIALHVVKREVVRESDIDRYVSYRLFPFRQQHIEVEHVFRRIVIAVLSDPVPDRICMSAFRELFGVGYHYRARLRSGFCLILRILHHYVTYTEISARYREFHTLQLVRNIYAYLLFNSICVVFSDFCGQVVVRDFECAALYSLAILRLFGLCVSDPGKSGCCKRQHKYCKRQSKERCYM